MKVWNVITDSNMFCELVTDFLQDHTTPTGEPIPDAPVVKAAAAEAATVTKQKVGEMSEEEQLKAAIAASLQEPIRICDDDDDIETFSCDGDDESPIEVESDVVVVNDLSDQGATAAQSSQVTEKEAKVQEEDYKQYYGQDERMADLVLRLPDGGRETLTLPSDSKLKVSSGVASGCQPLILLLQLLQAIFVLVQSKGFSLSQYDIVTNFPRRCIHDLPPDSSLCSLGLMKEQLYIQLKH